MRLLALLALPLLVGCASSYIHIEHVLVQTSVGAGCSAKRGSESTRNAQGEGDVGVDVLTQSGDAEGTGAGALAAMLNSEVECQ